MGLRDIVEMLLEFRGNFSVSPFLRDGKVGFLENWGVSHHPLVSNQTQLA